MILRSLYFLSLAVPSLFAQAVKVSPEWFQTPEFRKKFVGSYGFLPKVEPKVDQEEATLIAELSEILSAQRYKEAETRLLSFIKERKNPVDPEVEAKDVSAALVFTLGNLYYQNGRTDDAESAYKTAIKRFPEYRRAHKNLALLYARSERMKQAKPHLIKAMELGDADHLSYGLLGHAMLAEDKALAAEAAFRQAYLTNPNEKDWQVGLVQALLSKEDWAQAASMMQSLIDDNPGDPVMWKQQANCYIQMDDFMRAAENFEVLRLKGIADEGSLNTLGDIYSRQEEPLLALGAYLSAIRMSEVVDVDRTLKSAGYLLQLEAPKEAAELMVTLRAKAGAALSKDQQVAAFVVESDIADADQRYQVAADLLKQALVVDPASGESKLKLGEMYSKLAEEATDEKKIKALKVEARTAFELATGDTDPKVGYKANLRLASMLVKAQDYIDALPLIEEAIRLKTGSKESIEQYKRRVERAAARQKEKEERLEQKRRETREAIEKADEEKKAAEEEKKAKDSKKAKEAAEKSGAEDGEKKEEE